MGTLWGRFGRRAQHDDFPTSGSLSGSFFRFIYRGGFPGDPSRGFLATPPPVFWRPPGVSWRPLPRGFLATPGGFLATPPPVEMKGVPDALCSPAVIGDNRPGNQAVSLKRADGALDAALAEARTFLDPVDGREALASVAVVSVRKHQEHQLGGWRGAFCIHGPGARAMAHPEIPRIGRHHLRAIASASSTERQIATG